MTKRRYLRSMQGLRNVHPPTSSLPRSALRWLAAWVNMGQPVGRIVHADAGWHFSSMGGIERVAQKFNAFSHAIPERRKNPLGSITDMAAARVRRAITDDNLRNVELDTSYPASLLENRERFAHLLAER
jgi:beta-1,4-mannosyl-glycoprotein beta-1,4-N-acetylglucosaminyltransferase